jgi:biopolymer transport protein ExbB
VILVFLAAGTPDQAALAAGISEALIPQLVLELQLAIISYNTSKIDDLTYSIDEAAVSIVNYRRFRGSLKQ